MTDNTPTTKQDEGGLVETLTRMAVDYQRSTADVLDRIRAQIGRDDTEAWNALGYAAHDLRVDASLREMGVRAPATPPHNEDGVRKLAERLHQAADDIVSGETIFSDRVHGLLWEAADALSRQALGDIPSG